MDRPAAGTHPGSRSNPDSRTATGSSASEKKNIKTRGRKLNSSGARKNRRDHRLMPRDGSNCTRQTNSQVLSKPPGPTSEPPLPSAKPEYVSHESFRLEHRNV